MEDASSYNCRFPSPAEFSRGARVSQRTRKLQNARPNAKRGILQLEPAPLRGVETVDTNALHLHDTCGLHGRRAWDLQYVVNPSHESTSSRQGLMKQSIQLAVLKETRTGKDVATQAEWAPSWHCSDIAGSAVAMHSREENGGNNS